MTIIEEAQMKYLKNSCSCILINTRINKKIVSAVAFGFYFNKNLNLHH